MKKLSPSRAVPLLLAALVLFGASPSLQACAVCWGSANSKVTDAMGFAILFLLGLVGLVLAGIVAVFVTMARRARRFPVPSDGAAFNH